MNAKPTLARPRVVTTIAAAALSIVIAIGLLTAVTGLFQRDGAPGVRPSPKLPVPSSGLSFSTNALRSAAVKDAVCPT